MIHAVRPFHPVRYKEGETHRTPPYKTGETFGVGAVIVRTSGAETVEEGGTDPTPIVGVALAGAADYAWMRDTFGSVVPAVPIALSDQEFRGTLGNSDTSTPEVIADVSAIIGAQYGLVKDTATGYWVIDADDTTNKRVQITGVDDGVADGDGNIPVTFVFLPANRDVIA